MGAHTEAEEEEAQSSSSKLKKMIFVGYSHEHKAYRFLHKTTRKVYISRDARFVGGEPAQPTENIQEESTVEYQSTLKPTVMSAPSNEIIDDD